MTEYLNSLEQRKGSSETDPLHQEISTEPAVAVVRLHTQSGSDQTGA